MPVYKVEKFLHKCVDSILNQTFNDFDLILVDDGSPDNSGKICDEYAEKDKRVKVLHKENGGLSDARNFGLDWAIKNCNGKYICFIDSDDYVEPDMLSVAFSEMEKSDADIVCFGIKMVDESGEELSWGSTRISKDKTFGYDDRFRPITGRSGVGDYAVNKLYKKELFDGVRYPVGQVFEDVYTAYKIFDKAQKVVVLPQMLYIYVRHKGSITRSGEKGVVDKKIYHFFYASEEKYKYISSVSRKCSREAIAGVATSIYTCIRTMFWQKNLADFSEDISFFRAKIQEYWGVIKKSRFVDKRHKKALKLFVKDFDLCEKFMNKKKSDFNFIDFCKGLLCKIIKRR